MGSKLILLDLVFLMALVFAPDTSAQAVENPLLFVATMRVLSTHSSIGEVPVEKAYMLVN